MSQEVIRFHINPGAKLVYDGNGWSLYYNDYFLKTFDNKAGALMSGLNKEYCENQYQLTYQKIA